MQHCDQSAFPSVRLLEALSQKVLRVGTALDANKPVSFLHEAAGASPKKPVLVVLGNEEHGISNAVKKNCDELVIIPWAGMGQGVNQSSVDSLNVAQAASIIFYEMTR